MLDLKISPPQMEKETAIRLHPVNPLILHPDNYRDLIQTRKNSTIQNRNPDEADNNMITQYNLMFNFSCVCKAEAKLQS